MDGEFCCGQMQVLSRRHAPEALEAEQPDAYFEYDHPDLDWTLLSFPCVEERFAWPIAFCPWCGFQLSELKS